ncbi:unnamed protein product (macronuclear) [Paramecium tetraurelia]|uniref:PUM-HD domain-containing protein n=1 Tax=Paramecium tetraurelia TaxID=5888 RepID=A0CR00_PARTE|nr:uncharacterized protein GSPATT00038873001 [Paramecium tetraurelia]CAK73217.1 unnamed protein product [Paramecium tetraurelia]|eukprot:XP_001440614.1 hypothetical protein (macronuclear) [Paramecium tetraurelia strain d4-2]
MLDDIYPLFGWNEPVPTEFKEIFSKCVKKETELGHDSNSRKCSSTLEESLIVDEDYEIIGKSQNDNSICPICYQNVQLGNTQLYSNHLSLYFDVHTQCALMCKQKPASLALLHEHIQSAKFIKRVPIDYDLLDLNIKAFVEFRVFHTIAQKPFLHLTHSTTLKQKKTTSILIDYANLREYFGKRPKYLIPFLQGRIQIELYIIDANLMQEGKSARTFEFYYNAEQAAVGDYISLESDGVCISMQLEEESIQLSIKSLQITLPSELSTSLIKQSPKSSPIIDSFLFSPKLNNFTPQVGPIQSRVRLQSFQLEETIQTPIDEWTEDLQNLEQIRGNVVNFVKTQHGSRLIQKYFTTCTQIELDQLLQEIGPHLPDLMIDPYANYMFGSLSQSCAPHQRLYILQTIGNRLVDIACDKKGTHAIQSLVSLISCKQEEEMVENSIKNNIIPLTLDSQGTHLIKKIIARFSEDRLNYIFHKLMDRFIQVVNHQFGLCVLKDLITKFKNNLEKSAIIINRMKDHLDEIIQDPFGNYGVQHVIDVYGDLRCNCIIDKILLKLIQLSIHKYSSNVVEKCILETSPKTQKRFIKQLSQDIICLELMKNKFGTFVLQKALQEADKLSETDSLQQALYRNLPSIYAQNIRQKWFEYLSKK